MSISITRTILSEMARIDSSPGEIQHLYEALRNNQGVIAPGNKRLLAEREKLIDRRDNMPVVLKGGGRSTIKKVTSLLKEQIPRNFLNGVVVDEFYNTPPFDSLGDVPIAESEVEAARPGASRLREICPIVSEHAQKKVPLALDDPRSHAIWMILDHHWFSPIILPLVHRCGSTSVTASGWDAADRAGPFWRDMKHRCLKLELPSPDDPAYPIMLAMRDAYHRLAENAPEIVWRAGRIRTILGSGNQMGAHDGSSPYENWPDTDRMFSACTLKDRTWTNRVRESHTDFGVSSFGVASWHEVNLFNTRFPTWRGSFC